MADELPEVIVKAVKALGMAQTVTGARGVRARELRSALRDLHHPIQEQEAGALLEDLARAGLALRLALKGPRRYVITEEGKRVAKG